MLGVQYYTDFTRAGKLTTQAAVYSLHISLDVLFNDAASTAEHVKENLLPYRYAGDKGDMYSSYSFLTSILDGGEWSASRPGHALPTGT
jgi:hypothetical protein